MFKKSNIKKEHNKRDIFFLIIKYGNRIIILSVIGEIILFPTIANAFGCAMTIIAWIIFKVVFLKKDIILLHTFSFIAYLSIFLACFIPLPATLLEFKPISYGFQNPIETFFYQTLIFIVASLALYKVVNTRSKDNNVIQKVLQKLNFFSTNSTTLWSLGLLGLFSRIISISVANEVQYGDVGSKFSDGFKYLQYSPILMLFPTLSGVIVNSKAKKIIYFYIIILIILSFATNSRQEMIYPICTILLLFVIYLIKENISILSILSPYKIVLTLLFIFFGLGLLSDISLAMLKNRALRKEKIDRVDLLVKTMETVQNEEVMQNLRNISSEDKNLILSYNTNWTEVYLNNFMFNRFANLRVVDQTIFYANKIGFANIKMQETFVDKIFAIFPLPLINTLGINLDKNKLNFSPGDMLYYIGTGNSSNALGGYRVTSLVGDGLATFGYWCFPIIYFLLYFTFKLLDSLIYFSKTTFVYSTIGLINIFGIFGMLRNSIGCVNPLNYLLRGFWQQCITFWLLVFIINKFQRFEKKKNLITRS